ncbi:MAG: PEP-CTERM sorting domain-containing protein [Phycisphaerae bacterium]|nr:PEP-CTERM sorting domain-containing protein [Phycisphaerae bacterium]
MKKVLCIMFLTGGLLASQAAAIPPCISVEFAPSAITVDILDGPFTVDIVADIPELVFGWGLDLELATPGIVSQMAFDLGGVWDEPGGTGDGDGLAGLAFPDSVSGDDILLGTFTFIPTGIGTTDLNLSYTLGDLGEGFALDPAGFADVMFTAGSITVIPEPTALALLAFGGFVLIRRR